MGVLFDYFRAPDAAAAQAMELPTGPLVPSDAGLSVFDGVATKGVDPAVVLGQLVAIVREVPWTTDVVRTESVWPPPETAPATVTSTPMSCECLSPNLPAWPGAPATRATGCTAGARSSGNPVLCERLTTGPLLSAAKPLREPGSGCQHLGMTTASGVRIGWADLPAEVRRAVAASGSGHCG